MPNHQRSGRWQVSAVRVAMLPDGWWQALIYWRGDHPPLFYGPVCRSVDEARQYARAVAEWIEGPRDPTTYLVWDGCQWVLRSGAGDVAGAGVAVT